MSINDIERLPPESVIPAEPPMKYSVVDQGDEVPLGTRSGVYVAPARGIVLVKAGKPTFLPVDDVRLLAAELGLIK